MKLELLHTDNEPNFIPKDFKVIDTLDISLKRTQGIMNPIILIKRKDTIDYTGINYARLQDKRYYFVSDLDTGNKDIITLRLKEDVLETYKDDILNSTFDIVEKGQTNNIKDVPVSKEVETVKYTSPTVLPKTSSVVMVTVGSKGED